MNDIFSPTQKKARFLLLKQKDVTSSPTFQIEFPKSFSELFEIARTKFKDKLVVRTLYNQENSIITSLDSLKSGSIIYVSSKNQNQNLPKKTTDKPTRGLSVQIRPNLDILPTKSETPSPKNLKNQENIKTANKSTPSPRKAQKKLTNRNRSETRPKKEAPIDLQKQTSLKKNRPISKSPSASEHSKISLINQNTNKEKTELSPKNIAKDSPQNLKKDSSQNIAKDSPQNLKKDSSQNIVKDSPQNLKKDSPQNIVKDSPQNLKKEPPQNLIKDSSHKETPTNKNSSPNSSKEPLPLPIPTPKTSVPSLPNKEPIPNKNFSQNSPKEAFPNAPKASANESPNQIMLSPSQRPRASSLRSKPNRVDSPTGQISTQNQDPGQKIIFTPSPPVTLAIQKPPPMAPTGSHFSFSGDDDNDASSKPRYFEKGPNIPRKLLKKRNSKSSTYFQLGDINGTDSPAVQTTSKTYLRLKNNIIQEDPPFISKTRTVSQLNITSTVGIRPNQEFNDDTNIDPKRISFSLLQNKTDSPEYENERAEDDDTKLFSQLHLHDKRGRRSNTLFSKMKSIESAIEILTYLSPRSVTLKSKQANIQSDDDEENVYKTSPVKTENAKKSEKDGQNKDTEKDSLDAFRDSEGSDLFSDDDDGQELSLPKPLTPTVLSLNGANNGVGILNLNANKGPLLSLNPANLPNEASNNQQAANPINIVPVPYKAPMSSPANLDEFMESDDDMLMFGSDDNDKGNNDKLSPLTIKPTNVKDYSDESDEYDDYDYDEYEIQINNFVDGGPVSSPVKSRSSISPISPLQSKSNNADNEDKLNGLSAEQSPDANNDSDNHDSKGIPIPNHNRSYSRSSYSFQNQSNLDITAIIDGSLQSPISIPKQEIEEDDFMTFDIIPRNRSNSVVPDSESSSSTRTRNSPRIPKKPEFIQHKSSSSNANSNSGGSSAKGRPRRNSGNYKQKSKSPIKPHSGTLTPSSNYFTKVIKSVNTKLESTGNFTANSARPRTNSQSSVRASSSTSSMRRSHANTISRSSTNNHYERIILSLMDSISTGQKIQNDEDLVFNLIDKSVGKYPQEALGLPIDVTPSKILPIMENQQALAWIAHGCLIASLQCIPDVDPSTFCYEDMVDYSREILKKHLFYNESKLNNKMGSLMGCNLRVNVGIIGPRNSGKSTFLRVMTDQLISDLVLTESWRSTFVFIFNMQNFSFESLDNNEYEFDVRRFYLTMIDMTIQHLLWNYPQLLGITKQLSRYFQSIVSPNRKHPRRFPRALASYKPEISHELQNIACILSTLWITPTAFDDFLNAILLFPKMVAKAFNFTSTFFIIDHFDVCHRFVEPPRNSPFFGQSHGVWLTDMFRDAFIENTNFAVAAMDTSTFYKTAFATRNRIEVFATTNIVKRPASKISGSISDVIFAVEVEGRNEPLILALDACGGAPRYLYLWNKMNIMAGNFLDLKIENSTDALIQATKLFLETLFVDENGSKIDYDILSVKRMKKKTEKIKKL